MKNINSKDEYCSSCNTPLLYPEKPCPKCGYKKPNIAKKTLDFKIIVKRLSLFTFIGLIIVAVFCMGSSKIAQETSPEQSDLDFMESVNYFNAFLNYFIGMPLFKNPPDCNSLITKDLINQIFLENYLKDYSNKYREVSYSSPTVESVLFNGFDKETKKYSCEADVKFTRTEVEKHLYSEEPDDITQEDYACSINYTTRITQDSKSPLVSLELKDNSNSFWNSTWISYCKKENNDD